MNILEFTAQQVCDTRKAAMALFLEVRCPWWEITHHRVAEWALSAGLITRREYSAIIIFTYPNG